MTMKKILFTMIAMLMTLALNAQISVWDGTYENWDTIHSGTTDDPILIENAAQLARMSQFIYCSQEPKYYKLTTDIDLDNRHWNPIGDLPYITCPEFNGYFDGDNHTIYNPSNTLFFHTYNGYIKNLTTKGSDVYREEEFNNFGMITYSAPLVENCHNYCNITIDGIDYLSVGGIVGMCDSIINCSNHGTITVNSAYLGHCYTGGVAGEANFIESCNNTSDLNIELSNCNKCKIGGISGLIITDISHSYNTGNIMVNCENSYAGGIVGDMNEYINPLNDIFINSCYNAGNIEAANVGGIIAKTDYENITINVDNCYYINTIASINDYGSPKSESEMKTQDFVNLLNDGGNFYAMDDLYVNRGFPIFAIYYSVDETVFENKISVYPNPANCVVTISGDNLLKIEIFNIIGQTVFSTICNADENTINIANLNSGIYLIKVGTTNGKEFATRIVKE